MRRIELTEEPSEQALEVRVSAGLATAFIFHGGIIDRDTVTLEGHERMRISIAEDTLLLIPSEQVVAGERLRLSVSFKDGAVPASTTLMLVAHPARAERQVELYRQRRPAESLRAEVKEKDAQLKQCHDKVESLQAEQRAPRGLTGLLVSEQLDRKGVSARDITRETAGRPGGPLKVLQARSFRSAGLVMVELWVENLGTEPWRASAAMLTGKEGVELPEPTVWHPAPISPGSPGVRIVVEAEAARREAHGPMTLTLWEAETGRALVLSNVSFP